MMKIAVWDTYVPKKDNTIMNFDILVPEDVKDEESIFAYGRKYLATKGQEGQPLSAKECSFCHIEKATQAVETDIKQNGYSIIEMENC